MAQQQAQAFALVPADASGALFDYTSREGLEIFKVASRSLYAAEDDRFNVESDGLQTFLGLLKLRSIITSWSFTVPIDNNDPNSPRKDMLTQHGEITLEYARKYCASFVNGQNRLAQENMQMMQAILNSMSLPGFNKVQVWKEQWMVGDIPAALLLVKVIIRKAFIDTNATTRILREKLSSLPEQLAKFNNDITALNSFVMVTLSQLNARGESTTDLLPNLFKGYLSTGDCVFTTYIEKKQEEYDEGSSLTHTQLMEKAANKYKTMVENGTWMAPSAEEKKIIALEAKLQKMQQKERKPPSFKPPNNGPNTNKPRGQAGKGQKGKSKPNPKNKQRIEEWMTKYPGDDFVAKGLSKTVNGKQWWWCKLHKRFVRHKTSECKLAHQVQTQGNESSPQFCVSSAVLMDE